MNIKTLCIAIFTFAFCTANSQAIRRIVPDPTIGIKQYNLPQRTVYRSDDGIIKTGLTGIWKDQNAVIQFKTDGYFTTDFDAAPDISGTRSINNRILRFIIYTDEDEYNDEAQYYFIISFNGKKMEYQQLFSGKKDQKIWIAVKQ